jgi:hypothetical protein
LLLVITDFFRRRRRPRRASDALPMRPLLQVLALWTLLSIGGLMASIAGTGIVAVLAFDVPLDRVSRYALAVLGVAAIVCLWRAVVLWFRLNRA